MTVLSKVFKKLKLKTFILTKKIVLINYYSWLQKKSERFGFERRKSSDFWHFGKYVFLGYTIEESLQPNWLIPTYTFIHICVLSKNVKSDSFFFLFRKDYFCQYYPAMWPWRWKQTLQASQWTNSSTKFTYRNMKMSGKILHSDTQNLHWKSRQLAPSFGSILTYLETTAKEYFLGIKLFCFSK